MLKVCKEWYAYLSEESLIVKAGMEVINHTKNGLDKGRIAKKRFMYSAPTVSQSIIHNSVLFLTPASPLSFILVLFTFLRSTPCGCHPSSYSLTPSVVVCCDLLIRYSMNVRLPPICLIRNSPTANDLSDQEENVYHAIDKPCETTSQIK